MPEEMRAIEITKPGGPDVLAITKRPCPKPLAGEILIKVHVAGVNRPDALQRAGLYNPPKGASDLPGLEAAGEVVALGVGVAEFAVGDYVCALLPGGGYAEYVTTPAAHALPVPKGFDLIQAAALPETFFTVWTNVVMRGALKAGERFLVHGGSSGIGTTAIQLAQALGARVFATAGSDAKCDACMALGAERAFNYKSTDFGKEIAAFDGVDLILDMVGGDYLARNLRVLRPEGRMVQIAFLQGAKAEINFAPMMMKRQVITGSTLRPQSLQAKAEIAMALKRHVWPLLEADRIHPVIDTRFPLDAAAAAHRRLEGSEHIGKIMLEVHSSLGHVDT